MKKLYTLLSVLCLCSFAIAQTKMSHPVSLNNYHNVPQVKAAALGDTLFLFDGQNFYITNPDDQTNFDFLNQDVDQLTPAQQGYTSDWLFFFSLDATDLTPGWDTDSAFYMGASSWFTPAGQADNWFTFGPITIPANGAKLTFLNKSNPDWTDGFKVFASSTGLTPYTDFEPASDSPIFSKADCNPNPPACSQPAQDTIWTEFSTSLSAYAGTQVYIAFFHNTEDGDMCLLDHFVITETNDVGIDNSSGFQDRVFQNRPNPTGGNTVIKYELAQFNQKVEFNVFDITGKKVAAVNIGEKQAGKHELSFDGSVLSSGTYFYTLKTDNKSFTNKMIITK